MSPERSTRAIWKFSLDLRDGAQVITVPTLQTPVLVGVQGDEVCLWFDVDTSMKPREGHARAFSVHGTGHPIPENSVHVGSVQMGSFVWHVFEDERTR